MACRMRVESPGTASVIAVVEDDPAVRKSLEFALEAHGYAVCAFANGAEALHGDAIDAADCLVIDYNLPDGDGAVLLTSLRLRGLVCPAIFIAGNPTERCRRDVEACSAPLIEKPLIAEVLREHIRAALEQK